MAPSTLSLRGSTTGSRPGGPEQVCGACGVDGTASLVPTALGGLYQGSVPEWVGGEDPTLSFPSGQIGLYI